MLTLPPLSLYIHIPWCVQKCPYCDFNSHALKSDIDEQKYIEHLLSDLDSDIARFGITRALHSIFIGGGTPSLFSAPAIKLLLDGVKQRFADNPEIEITLEANPGTVEADKFKGFSDAGVNRLSVGVQSFASDKLIKLGRIHDSEQAIRAAEIANSCGVKSFNLDLMHGLENQTIEHALDDLRQAIALKPKHLSWYQLTIEPNTAFHSKPPKLPQDDTLWAIQEQGFELLAQAGYQQYEVSAFSQSEEFQSKHNINYWQNGDYLGIGCGAHGKITSVDENKIYRTVKVKHPKGYMDTERVHLDHLTQVSEAERPFEYMMNRLRLFKPFSLQDFERSTGLSAAHIHQQLRTAQNKQLLSEQQGQWQTTLLGRRYLNDLLELFI
ncbi:radical SAM family heme chaperone HemW [Thalassomonas sp. M1454]|uniref:radical SAM family heme chaperone HemW n=1 Tax=Thalassomonas sp. M1454 TaxID=2594477 RepID=UPI00117D65CE|nr:radical SAM family heme chaperone HemW [Thalassomonas sp. M1454]TRX55842.1 radical SAM family heme chaperone HemW [Thalassomonas sp. M1454]